MRAPILRAPTGVFALLALALTAGPAVAAYPDVGDHHPLWPTEVQRVADPLRDPSSPPPPESQRLAALRGLDRYATALVEATLLDALDDPSPQIRREALQRCHQRAIRACIPAALALWRGLAVETSNRLYALRVLLLEPTPEHVDVVLAALREPSELLRVEAARLLATTPLPDREGPRVRAALVAKLADPEPDVRRAIARALGLLAAPEATLVLSRMLEDPDPAVRRDAAEAIGMIGDPRALPALERAIDRGDEVFVARALLEGLARQPGEAVDRHLLELLDAPPRGLTSHQVALAIGGREAASPALLEGLLLRVREEPLRAHAIQALLWLGDQALPAIEAALARGVEDEVALELARLVRARRPGAATTADPAPPLPADGDRRGWRRRLTAADGLTAAAELGERAPAWLGHAIADALARPHGVPARRPWLVALATMTAPPAGPELWARVIAQADDRGLAIADRCLAVLALGRAPRGIRRDFGEPLAARAGDPRAAIRACAALALAGAGERAPALLEGLLLDPSPRVRSAAALALAAAPRPGAPLRSRLALIAQEDEDGRVRAAAAWAGRSHAHAEPPRRAWIQGPTATPGWIDVEAEGARLALPALRLGDASGLLLATPVPLEVRAAEAIGGAPYRDEDPFE